MNNIIIQIELNNLKVIENGNKRDRSKDIKYGDGCELYRMPGLLEQPQP